jgi:hypothetical protein
VIAYLKPGSEGLLVASAEVRQQGEQVLVCEAGVEQDGELLVTALATLPSSNADGWIEPYRSKSWYRERALLVLSAAASRLS